MDDRYITIARPAQCEIKIKGSRFIGRTALVADVASAESNLATIRKQPLTTATATELGSQVIPSSSTQMMVNRVAPPGDQSMMRSVAGT